MYVYAQYKYICLCGLISFLFCVFVNLSVCLKTLFYFKLYYVIFCLKRKFIFGLKKPQNCGYKFIQDLYILIKYVGN